MGGGKPKREYEKLRLRNTKKRQHIARSMYTQQTQLTYVHPAPLTKKLKLCQCRGTMRYAQPGKFAGSVVSTLGGWFALAVLRLWRGCDEAFSRAWKSMLGAFGRCGLLFRVGMFGRCDGCRDSACLGITRHGCTTYSCDPALCMQLCDVKSSAYRITSLVSMWV
jgi:hypothetical protein